MVSGWFKKDKILVIISLLILSWIIIGSILYHLYGHKFIETIYEGRSIGNFNKIIEGQTEHALEYYFELGDKSVLQFPFSVAYIYLFLLMIIYLLRKAFVRWPETNTHKLYKDSSLDKPEILNVEDGNRRCSVGYLAETVRTFFKKSRIDLILFIFLTVVVIRFTYSIESVKDLGLGDEAFYLNRGIKLNTEGLPNPQYAPLYAIWYYILSQCGKDNIIFYYMNYRLLIFITTLTFFVYLRRIKVMPFISFIASFLFLVSGVYHITPLVALFALLVLLVFLVLTTFAKSVEDYYCLAGLGILMTSFVRPEYFISFILLCLFFLFMVLHKVKSGLIKFRFDLFKILLFLLIAASLVYIFGIPLSGDRSWITFAQHFSKNYVNWHNLLINPHAYWEQIIPSVFGDANTIVSAAISNPKEFLRHILCNAANYVPSSINILLIEFRSFLISPLNKLIDSIELLFFIVVAIYVFKIRSKATRMQKDKTLMRLILILIIPALISGLLMYPRKHYLIIQGAFILVLLSKVISGALEKSVKARQVGLSKSLMVGLLVLFLTPDLGKGWFFKPYKIGTKPLVELPAFETIEFIRRLKIAEKANILGVPGGYNLYLGENFEQKILPYGKEESFINFIISQKIDIIILTESLKKDIKYVDDMEFKSFLENPKASSFTKFEIPNTKVCIFVKEKLLKKS